MCKITVSRYGGFAGTLEVKTVDTDDIPNEWFSFLIKTGFGQTTLFLNFTNNNDYMSRVGYGKQIYRVDGCNRTMTYDSNFDIDSLDKEKFMFLKRFVEYILSSHTF